MPSQHVAALNPVHGLQRQGLSYTGLTKTLQDKVQTGKCIGWHENCYDTVPPRLQFGLPSCNPIENQEKQNSASEGGATFRGCKRPSLGTNDWQGLRSTVTVIPLKIDSFLGHHCVGHKVHQGTPRRPHCPTYVGTRKSTSCAEPWRVLG